MEERWSEGGVYCFGDKQVNIIKSLLIPVNLNVKKLHLITKVVEGDIPWLLGKRTLKKMGALLDIGRGVMKVSDIGYLEVPFREDRGGHLKVYQAEGAHRMYVW